MNLQRYVIAGGASLALHAALLLVSNETKVFAMAAGNPVSSVSLNLVAAPKPTQPQPAPKEEVAEVKEPEPKPVNKPVEKPIVKKEVVKKKPVEKKPEPVQKPKPKVVTQSEPKPEKQVEKKLTEKKVVKEPVPEQMTKPTPQSKGVSAQPVLLDKPAFVSQPVQPSYPRSARKRGIEGVALYEIWLDENGNQIKQVLIESSGADMLDNSALRAIKQWQFSPHISGGQQVAHRVQIPVRFKLDG